MLRPTQRYEFVIRLGLSLGIVARGKSRVVVFVLVLAGLLIADTVSGGPPASAQTVGSSIEYAENSTASVGRFRAHDQDGNVIRWSLSGPDADRFTIDGGILSFREPPNYEKPQSAQRSGQLANRNVYRVTVEAAGGRHDVTVTVTDVDDAGTDEGMYLRATVTYSDRFGSGKTASA